VILNLAASSHQLLPKSDQGPPLPHLKPRKGHRAQLIDGRQLRCFQGITAIILFLHLPPAPGIVAGVGDLHFHPQPPQQITYPTSDIANFDYAVRLDLLY